MPKDPGLVGSSPLEAKLTPEGRVVVPAAIRRLLGISAGDHVLFLAHPDGRVSLTSARAMRHALWANNHGGDARDSGADVRATRDADSAAELQQLRDVAEQDSKDERSPEAVTADLFAALGIPCPE